MSNLNLSSGNRSTYASVLQVWSNYLDNSSFKAFLSTLSLSNVRWQVQHNYQKANIWCLLDIEHQGDELSQLYLTMLDKPKVVCLGSQFISPPIAEWVFFKAPINVQALNNWLIKCQFLENDKLPLANPRTQSGREKWRHQYFKLQFWPNVSNYTDSPEIVQICSMMMRDWTNYDRLMTSNLSEATIQKLLTDAEEEGNLIYSNGEAGFSNESEQLDSIENVQQAEVKDGAWGFFKGLFSRFVR